jgi:radical SAM protein (TIGR01212 family)
MAEAPYNKFSRFLFEKYGRKIYKIPVNIPCGCPNRDGSRGSGGCIFCGDEAAGFESIESTVPVREQLQRNIDYIGPKYSAGGFIAYFQNYSNTYIDFQLFKKYMEEACTADIVALYVSTRPDCIFEYHADFLKQLSGSHGIDIVVEMGLQSTNDSTLEFLNRGHSAEDFFKSAEMLQTYGIGVCAHMITDLPMENRIQPAVNAALLSKAGIDQVKCHSLYVLKNTRLGDLYETGEIKMLNLEDFIERTISFLRNLDKSIVVQRLMGRAPSDRTLFCNYGRSWRAVVDEIERRMILKNFRQGDLS